MYPVPSLRLLTVYEILHQSGARILWELFQILPLTSKAVDSGTKSEYTTDNAMPLNRV